MAEYPKYPASFDAFKKLISEGTVSHKSEPFRFGDPAHASTPYITWDLPKSDPLADIKAMYEMYGIPLPGASTRKGVKVGSGEYWTASEVARHPELKRCSKCNSMRTAQMDPWVIFKRCPGCGNADEIIGGATLSEPTSLGWEDVQKLLVGILRQVPDNKVQVHPAEFETAGITFKQETDTETGIVTIWFETSDEPVVRTPMCPSQSLLADASGFVACTEPLGHSGDHKGVASPGAGRLVWPNKTAGVMSKCAKAMPMADGGKAVCHQPHGHSGNHMGIDSSTHHTIAWSSV